MRTARARARADARARTRAKHHLDRASPSRFARARDADVREGVRRKHGTRCRRLVAIDRACERRSGVEWSYRRGVAMPRDGESTRDVPVVFVHGVGGRAYGFRSMSRELQERGLGRTRRTSRGTGIRASRVPGEDCRRTTSRRRVRRWLDSWRRRDWPRVRWTSSRTGTSCRNTSWRSPRRNRNCFDGSW